MSSSKKMKAILLVSLLITNLNIFAEEKFKVITTFTVIADIAQNVAGDKALVESITKPDAEIHNYQVTPCLLYTSPSPRDS